MITPSISLKTPSGPTAAFDGGDQDLLGWLCDNYKRYGDLYRYRSTTLKRDVYVAFTLEYAYHILRNNWRNYSKGHAFKRIALLTGKGLIVSDGEFWSRQRRMVQPAFHRNAVAAWIDVIIRVNAGLLKRWNEAAKGGTSVNVTADTSSAVLEVTVTLIFGDDYDEVAAHFKILSQERLRNLTFAQAVANLRMVVQRVIDRRRDRDATNSDILGALMSSRDDLGQPMTDHQLISEIMTLLVAGHETTANTLNMMWCLLSQHPDVANRLARDLESLLDYDFTNLDQLSKYVYARYVIDETLRLYPPVWLITRRALGDDNLGEYFVPAGAEIFISPYLIQRRPDIWEEPERFKPERFDSPTADGARSVAMLAFSAGPRSCVGESLARLEMQIHLMIIAQELRLRYDDKVPMEFEFEVNLRSKHDFVMTPQVRR